MHHGGTTAAQTVMALMASWIHCETHVPLAVMKYSNAARAMRGHLNRRFLTKQARRDIEQLVDDYDDALAVAKEATLVATALLRCWSAEIGVPPDDLLQTIALGQAMDREEANQHTE